MGCVPKSLELLKSYVHLVGGFSGRKMLELGNQQMYCHPDIPEASAAKLYFQSQGVDHTSIDLNGLLGALPLDLSKPIDKPEWNEAFDIVTDFGTSEHVGNTIEALYNCRRSCHTFCRPGGLLVFMNPKTGNWPGHGYHYFTQEHYRRLVDEAGYTVLEISEHPTLGNTADGWQIHAALLRGRSPFPDFASFLKVYSGSVFSE